MMRLKIYLLVVLILIGVMPEHAPADQGDQFLDGIGETAMIARYLFNGNTEDRSRNSFHATLHGDNSIFVEDGQFGKVLCLPGGDSDTYIQIPGQALIDTENLSITGWINVKALTPWQRFFDLGQGTEKYFYCTPVGMERARGCRVRMTDAGYSMEKGPVSYRVIAGKWVHLAAVLNATDKSLSLYVDGLCVARTSNVLLSLMDIINQSNPDANKIYIGKSLYDRDACLGGKIYDVRFYRIALTDKQVSAIHCNAISDEEMVVDDETDQTNNETLQDKPRFLAKGLVGVPDIRVKTNSGYLPKLPHYIPGTYREGRQGPQVRVIWPTPVDNSAVSKPGTYTVSGSVPGTSFKPKATVVVTSEIKRDAPKQKLEPFGLGDVVLNHDQKGRMTPFMKNRDKFIRGLAKTDPDSFLYNFRDAFGQKQPEGARPLGGWDSQATRLRGHASGHYLTAIAQAYAGSGYDNKLQADFAAKMNYMIDVLYDLSRVSGKPAAKGGPFNSDPAMVPPGVGKDGYDSDLSKKGIRRDYWNWGEGFISGYPPDQFIMLEQGATYGGSNSQIWAPYYTLHKILAGLMDCYEVGGTPKALEIARGMGIWVYKRLNRLPAETRIKMWNRYIAGEYGGMNEAMARLHKLTGDQRFLECARLFDNINLFFGNVEHEHGLAKNVDTIRGKHANQHIPQITGALETFKCTGEKAYYHVADNFWDIFYNGYMYSIGGVAGGKNPPNAECFTAQPNTLFRNGFSHHGQNETCGTYNLLKLSRQMFMFDQDAKFMDYYEQALYNHILASVAEDNPGNTYHVPLNPGARKGFGNARMSGFTCCNGTALESSTKLQDSIYFKSIDDRSIYVNLYIPSTLKWKKKKVTIIQQTCFPYDDEVTFELTGGGAFDILFRVPGWASQGFSVSINGKNKDIEPVPGAYLKLSRQWKDGDKIQLQIPMDFHLCPLMDQPNIAGIFYGPVLLAAEESSSLSHWRSITLSEDISKSFTGDPAGLRFSTNGLHFKPFYETYDRYSVYFDVNIQEDKKEDSAVLTELELEEDYPFEPVPFTAVDFNDVFWTPRMETNRTVTIPTAFKKCEESKRYYNFERAAKRLAGEELADIRPPGLTFDDTDPYKVLEGASFGLSVKFDPAMDDYLDKVIALIASAQEPDGYLFTARTMQPKPPHSWSGDRRWVNVKRLSHELYNMGHLYEAAVAHFHATGKRSLLDIAIKNADLLCETFGPGKNDDAPGHQIIEMGLVRLYRASGNEKYLDLAKFFLDTRGPGDGEYSQAHLKVTEQDEAVGHAVRATYMYCGMADVAAIRGEQGYIHALGRIWENVVSKKLYITGGIGATSHGEAFGQNYHLPNMSAYCETCAAIGNVYWNHRMFLLHGESKYIDVMERALYNGLISGISLEGKDFFYPNPLESKGQHKRSPWFGCACCPGNIARFLASVPGYAYAKKDDKIYVNLFVQGTAKIDLDHTTVKIDQKTRYPWDGNIRITVTPEKESAFAFCVRIPCWAIGQPVPSDLYSYSGKKPNAPEVKAFLNSERIPLQLTDGYLRISRKWKIGDTVELNLAMPAHKVIAHENVEADRDRISIERGPIVYCIEGADHPEGRVRNLVVSPDVKLETAYRKELLSGVQVITGDAFLVGRKGGGDEPEIKEKVQFTAIPYFSWCNRGANEMMVWLPTKISDAVLSPRPTIASQSRVTASRGSGRLACLVDQIKPESSGDKSSEMYHWWPKKGTAEWVQFEFDKLTELSGIEVYWLDDTGSGECRVPQSWKLMYKDGDKWKQVVDGNGYAVERNMFNRTSFKAVTTKAIRIDIQLQDRWSAGVLEVRFGD